MAAIGSLVFCTDCGNLLPVSKGNVNNVLNCECCGHQNKDIAAQTTVTQTKPSDFPSLLRQKLSVVQSVDAHKVQTEATTNETCEKCGRTEVRFSAVQLRSADEGSTIFYTCDCGHKWKDNN
ncbi:transcription factor S-II-domain-containing protein [Xylariaceae sp. FL0804]|nr:transcription factor S-II-domain-containing protein [Xylariaceae sp. FL0804]